MRGEVDFDFSDSRDMVLLLSVAIIVGYIISLIYGAVKDDSYKYIISSFGSLFLNSFICALIIGYMQVTDMYLKWDYFYQNEYIFMVSFLSLNFIVFPIVCLIIYRRSIKHEKSMYDLLCVKSTGSILLVCFLSVLLTYYLADIVDYFM